MSRQTARTSVSTSAVVALLSALSLSGVAIAQADKPATAPAAPTTPAEAPKAPATDKMIYATMSTSMGDIVLELNREKAPLSVDNFVEYARSGHYDGTVFHRVIPGFMVQGGGFTSDMTQKPTRPPIKNEWKNGLKNSRGTLAMARTSVIDSATSQFFINVVDNAALDMPRDGAAYAVFGRVVSGMDVADKIVAVPTTRTGPHANVPATPITITGVKILTPDEAAKFATPATPATPAAPTPPSAPKAPAAPTPPVPPTAPAARKAAAPSVPPSAIAEGAVPKVAREAFGPYLQRSRGVDDRLWGNTLVAAMFADEQGKADAGSAELPGGIARCWVQCAAFTSYQRDIVGTWFHPSSFPRIFRPYAPGDVLTAGIDLHEVPRLAYISPGAGRYVVRFKDEGMKNRSAVSFYQRFVTSDPDWTKFRSPTEFDPEARLKTLVNAGVTPLTLSSYRGWIWTSSATGAQSYRSRMEDAGHRFDVASPKQLDLLRRFGYGDAERLLHVGEGTPEPVRRWVLEGTPVPGAGEPATLDGWLDLDLRSAVAARGFLAGDLLYRAKKGEPLSVMAIVGSYSPSPAASRMHVQFFKDGRPTGPIETRSVVLDPDMYYAVYSTTLASPNMFANDAFREMVRAPGVSINPLGGEHGAIRLLPMVVATP